MLVDSNTLNLVFDGFKTVYTDACLSAPVHWDKIAMQVSGSGRGETYGWLGQFPTLARMDRAARHWQPQGLRLHHHQPQVREHGFDPARCDFR